MTRTPVALLAAMLLACGDPPPKTPEPVRVLAPGDIGYTCAVNGKVARGCKEGLVCRRAPPPPPAPAPNGPDIPRGEGGPCGGPAGFSCLANLACDMSRNFDSGGELGVCVRADLCLPPLSADAGAASAN